MFFFFFFNDTATTEIYTLSLHDALPISCFTCPALRGRTEPAICWDAPSTPIVAGKRLEEEMALAAKWLPEEWKAHPDRKSTRLNSSHVRISYAVFCLKQKKLNNRDLT